MRFRAVSIVLGIAEAIMAQTDFPVLPGRRQLFLDDYGVASIQNLARALHAPDKKGAVIRPARWFSINAVQTRSAPQWDPGTLMYRLWDCSTPADAHASGVYCGGYQESRHGLHWCQPSLGRFSYRGSTDNNFVFVPIGGVSERPDCVVLDSHDPDPARRYKGLSFVAPASLAPVVSANGYDWQPLDVPRLNSGDEFNLSYDTAARLFIATVKLGGRYGRAVGLYTSRDFVQWDDKGVVFESDDLDQERGRVNIAERLANTNLPPLFWSGPQTCKVDVYNMGVFAYEGLYIGVPAMFHAVGRDPGPGTNEEGFHLVQLVCSRDLATWRRVADRQTFIGPSPLGAGAYDLTQIIGPSDAVRQGDELWFYYTGIKYRGATIAPEQPRLDPDRGAICLAVLRRDGFVSLDAGETPGTVQTRPFVCLAARLCVNVDAPHGELRVEVLNAAGDPVAASEPVTGDRLREQIRWSSGDLAAHRGSTVSLRFTLTNASFYSWWLETPEVVNDAVIVAAQYAESDTDVYRLNPDTLATEARHERRWFDLILGLVSVSDGRFVVIHGPAGRVRLSLMDTDQFDAIDDIGVRVGFRSTDTPGQIGPGGMINRFDEVFAGEYWGNFDGGATYHALDTNLPCLYECHGGWFEWMVRHSAGDALSNGDFVLAAAGTPTYGGFNGYEWRRRAITNRAERVYGYDAVKGLAVNREDVIGVMNQQAARASLIRRVANLIAGSTTAGGAIHYYNQTAKAVASLSNGDWVFATDSTSGGNSTLCIVSDTDPMSEVRSHVIPGVTDVRSLAVQSDDDIIVGTGDGKVLRYSSSLVLQASTSGLGPVTHIAIIKGPAAPAIGALLIMK